MSTIARARFTAEAATRVVVGLLIVLALIAGAVAPAQARHAKHPNRHVHRNMAAPTRIVDASPVNLGLMGGSKSPMWRSPIVARAELAPQAPIHLGPMRYYGGPKSPMWRGPAEN